MKSLPFSLAWRLCAGLLGLCGQQTFASAESAATTAAGGRDTAHYTADQPVDFLHMRLEIVFTPEGLTNRTCEGRVEFSCRPRAAQVSTVRLDAVDLRLLGVELPGEGKAPEFSYDDNIISVQLPQPVGTNDTFKLAVKYRVNDPPKGMHFILPSASEPKKPLMVYTMSEPVEARYWVPCHDWPNERWTSEILITVPAAFTAVANGLLVEKKPSADGKAVTFHYRSEVPTDPHLTGLVIGELVELRDAWRGKPVLTYTQPGSEDAARFTFRRVPEVLEFYSRLIGVDFPYPAYTHVTVVDHHHGGMEHAGFAFVNPNYTSASDDGEWPLEHTESWLISHMLAHDWFGGLVNYRSVSQAWLNEGFALWLDRQWTAHTDAPGRFECQMWELSRQIAAADSSETGKPLVDRALAEVEDIYQQDGGKIYYKGAWVLQMLRHQLGEEVFWSGVRKYLHDHQGQAVETGDLRRALEEVSGRDLEQFFQQWVYGHGVPRLKVEYVWDVAAKRARVTVRQTQKIDAATPAFATPLDLYFRVGGQERSFTVELKEARHDFTYELAKEPALFCVDPKGGLLKTIDVTKPQAMWREQVLNAPTVLARLIAVRQLNSAGTLDAVEMLEQVLTKDAEFWKVREAAAEGLGGMQSEAALNALLRAEKKGLAPPRVLAAVISALGQYTVSREAHEAVLKHATPRSNLYVEAAAIGALGRLRGSPELAERSLQVLQTAARKPTRRWVRSSAFWALRSLEDARSYDAVFELAQPARGDELRPQTIPLLGRLGRHDELRDRTRTALTAWLYDPDRPAQAAAVHALGELGDPRAIADLERLRSSAQHASQKQAAADAIAAISRPQNPKQATAALLDRLSALEKQNLEIEKKLKTIADELGTTRAAKPPVKKRKK
ncbi:MAG: HEAT repeat domain-containing protein [Verrucomicrobia bacterium]|nr:HEAT repeat domain-containing protein [Verrucomicrobiota bacterium]